MTEGWWRTGVVPWRAHGWHLELRDDEIAEIRHHDRQVLRAVRAVVRDQGWQTVPAILESVESASDSLLLSLRHEGFGADVASVLRVTASADELQLTWEAVNNAPFDTCRMGLVVLHPASDAGRPVSVVHPDGSVDDLAFPTAISPHQPMKDIRELRIDGIMTLQFDGDVFEMEDQRNWSDSSFKTYSRPLALPYPYRMDAGESVRQSIRIHMDSADSAPPRPTNDPAGDAVIELRASGGFPSIGVEASTVPDPVPESAAGGFRVVELDLTSPAWRAALSRAAADRLPLDVRLVVDCHDTASIAEAAAALRDFDVRSVAAFDHAEHISTAPIVASVRAALRDAGIRVPILGGARSHFTELNRERSRIPRDIDGIVITTTPLFHALDTEQLVEAVAMQRLIAEQTVRMAEGIGVHIGPVSLRPRFNNVATTPQPRPTRADLVEGYGTEFAGASDPRQSAPQLAAWVMASAAAMAVPGVHSLSWFETWGPRGLEDAQGRLPVADAVDALTSLEGGELLTGNSPDGLIWAFGARTPETATVIVANLDRFARRLTVELVEDARLSVELPVGAWKKLSIPRAQAR